MEMGELESVKRRVLLASVGGSLVALGGCVEGDGEGQAGDDPGGSNGGEDEKSNGTIDVDRPECEIEPETIEVIYGDEQETEESVGTIPYPTFPENVTEEAIRTFVEDHEEAYIRHDYLCEKDHPERIIGFTYSVQRSWVFDGPGEISVVLEYVGGASSGVDSGGHVWVTDMGFSGVVYGVDEGGVARAEFDEVARLEGEESVSTEIPDPFEAGGYVLER